MIASPLVLFPSRLRPPLDAPKLPCLCLHFSLTNDTSVIYSLLGNNSSSPLSRQPSSWRFLFSATRNWLTNPLFPSFAGTPCLTEFCRVLALPNSARINTSRNCAQVLILVNLQKGLNALESTLTEKGEGATHGRLSARVAASRSPLPHDAFSLLGNAAALLPLCCSTNLVKLDNTYTGPCRRHPRLAKSLSQVHTVTLFAFPRRA